jgi:uncharacterized protein YgbK (DUF1537 family)
VYKKTDSTLRGNIGAELEALIRERKRPLPFIPAYPALGRTTLRGRQFLNGLPIDKTDMAADALNPVRRSYIPDIIAETSAIAAGLVSAPREKLKETAREISGNRKERIMIFDAETDEDLSAAAEALGDAGLLGISAGCAGFAEFLIRALPLESAGEKPALRLPRLPLLVVSGSRHPVSTAQIRTALESGVKGAAVEGEKLLMPEWFSGPEAASVTSRAAESLRTEGIFILGTTMSVPSMGKGPEHADLSGPGTAGLLGKLVKQINAAAGPLILAVFGGDTLLGIMEILEYEYLSPLGEIRPGIAAVRARGKSGAAFIVTKAGAFGDPGIIRTIEDFLHTPE